MDCTSGSSDVTLVIVLRRVSAFWSVSALRAALVMTVMCGCSKRPVTLPAMNAGYVQLVGLASALDSAHPVAMSGPDGQTWYAETAAFFDLGQCDYERATVELHRTLAKWMINVPVSTRANQILLEDSFRSRIGQNLGILLNGQLVVVWPIQHKLTFGFAILAFDTQEQADAQARIIRNGGVR